MANYFMALLVAKDKAESIVSGQSKKVPLQHCYYLLVATQLFTQSTHSHAMD